MKADRDIMITVSVRVNAPLAHVWDCWTNPRHITGWNQASADWHTPSAENDPRTGGRFNYRMAARDGSAAFDFTGTYTAVVPYQRIAYTMDDGRRVSVVFIAERDGVVIIEQFEPESLHSHELQREGWQAILTSFAEYAERGDGG